MISSLAPLAITLADQDAAIAQLRGAFAETRRKDPEAWKTTDHAIEVDAIHSTNELDGSTLTRAETAAVLESGVAYGAIPFRDFAAAVGDAEALALARRLATSARELSSNEIGRLIDLLQQSERPEIQGRCGRPSAERLARTTVLSPGETRLAAEWCAWMLVGRLGLRDAFAAHYEVAARAPAGRLAGRLARLLLNFLLAREGMPPLVIEARWQPEYRARTACRHAEKEGAERDEPAALAYQHFMGARVLHTLNRGLRPGFSPN